MDVVFCHRRRPCWYARLFRLRRINPPETGKGKEHACEAPAQPALLNSSLLFLHRYLKTGIQQGEVQKKTSISLTSTTSSRTDAYHCFSELGQYSKRPETTNDWRNAAPYYMMNKRCGLMKLFEHLPVTWYRRSASKTL